MLALSPQSALCFCVTEDPTALNCHEELISSFRRTKETSVVRCLILSIPWTCLHSWSSPCLAHLYSISWTSLLSSFQPHNSPNSLNPSSPLTAILTLFSFSDASLFIPSHSTKLTPAHPSGLSSKPLLWGCLPWHASLHQVPQDTLRALHFSHHTVLID